MDSSGFMTTSFRARWFDVKYGKEKHYGAASGSKFTSLAESKRTS